MGLVDVYPNLKSAIVAFAPAYQLRNPNEPRPALPNILGTGFIVREDGIVATNRHVVELMGKIPQPPGAKGAHLMAIMFHDIPGQGVMTVNLEVISATTPKEFKSAGTYYGNGMPDVAFVRVKALGLPTAAIDSATTVREGLEIATAGFPMGEIHMLNSRRAVAQVGPTLQRGIISGVWPAPCPTPHGYVINVMVQGGASGSPVFDTNTGKVIGILYGSRMEVENEVIVPTNFSLVEPAHYITDFLEQVDTLNNSEMPVDVRTWSEIVASGLAERPSPME